MLEFCQQFYNKPPVSPAFLVLIVVSLYFSAGVDACDNGTARISGQTDYPPLSWVDNNQLEGSSIEIAVLLFAEVGIKAQVDEGGPWKRVLMRAQNGEVDLLLGVRKDAERQHFLNFIEPALTPAVQSVFVHKARDFVFNQWSDLKGKSGNVLLGSSFGNEFELYQLNNLNIEYTETIEQGFQKLLLNRVDYILGPNTTYEVYLQKEKLAEVIVAKEAPLNIINEYFAFTKSSSCNRFAAHFSRRLTEIVNSGSIDKYLENNFIKWFEKFDPEPGEIPLRGLPAR